MNGLALFGHDLFGDAVKPKASGPVAEMFTFPPFTVLDARAGEWQDRKRAWIAMGLDGEIGRTCEGANAWNDLALNPRAAESTQKIAAIGDGPTVFDPVVCELAYRWFCPEGGQVIDPFAGGSVRGIVAGALGRNYWGCDLRAEQIAANEQQADDIAPSVRPVWVCGDSRDTLADAPDADLLFSCPPYGDLERYSDHESDLSAMSWTGFSIAYRLILHRAAARLKPNRFACFVVGNFRDTSTGFYRDLVGETVAAMREAGLGYYNEAVLVTSVGSASMRVTKQFNAGRKLCKTHQNVLVFCKGDSKKATTAILGVS
jgi:hypothetical protein